MTYNYCFGIVLETFNVGAVVGIVFGVIFAVLLIAVLVWWTWRKGYFSGRLFNFDILGLVKLISV